MWGRPQTPAVITQHVMHGQTYFQFYQEKSQVLKVIILQYEGLYVHLHS